MYQLRIANNNNLSFTGPFRTKRECISHRAQLARQFSGKGYRREYYKTDDGKIVLHLSHAVFSSEIFTCEKYNGFY